MDLFGDLPEPTNTAGDNTTAQPSGPERDKRKHEGHQEEQLEQKKVCKGCAKLKGFVAARRGERDEMQDAHVLLPDISSSLGSLPPSVTRLAYFAVFDGHGGSRASRFSAENLHHNVLLKFPKGEADNLDKLVRKCLVDSFKQTDEDFLKQASSQKPVWKDGTTATCVLVVNDFVYVANLGDSRAILCREETVAQQKKKKVVTLSLSKEHNPTCYEERIRIQKAGGMVRDGRVLGVLEVSRSIGDGQYKRCGVISTPDLRRFQLTPNDRFFILACDGVFKVFTAEQAVSFVCAVLEDNTVELRQGQTEMESRFEAACQRLASEAVKRGCADNVTVILVSVEV